MLLGALLVWFTGVGRDADGSDLLIEEALAKPLEGDGVGIFMQIANRGTPDRLIGVRSPAGEATLYSPVDPAGPPLPLGSSSLALDGAHVRLSGSDLSAQDGALLPVKLIFQRAGEVALKARLSDPTQSGAAQEVGLFGLGDICQVGKGEPAPRLTLSTESDGAGWRVLIAAEEFTFSEEFAGLYHIPGMGHGHLYVGGTKLGRLYANEARIGALPPGRHEVRVTLNTNDHRAYVVGDVPVTASTFITVD